MTHIAKDNERDEHHQYDANILHLGRSEAFQEHLKCEQFEFRG